MPDHVTLCGSRVHPWSNIGLIYGGGTLRFFDAIVNHDHQEFSPMAAVERHRQGNVERSMGDIGPPYVFSRSPRRAGHERAR